MYNTIILVVQGNDMGKKLTTATFVEKAICKHGYRYDYINVNYINSYSKVTLKCKLHGDFTQLPRNHLQGQGCPSCVNTQLKTKSDFVNDATFVHGDKYSYVKSKYVNGVTNILITCKLHGDFIQRPSHHISGHGCRHCGVIKTTSVTRNHVESFINKAKIKHNDRYDYSLVEYTNVDNVVTIICSLHGEFNQTPYNHYTGSGCPSCSKTGFNPLMDGYVYVLSSDCGQYMKIGITGNVKRRISVLNNKTPFNFDTIEIFKVDGIHSRLIERTMHDLCTSANFKGFDGCTEWFKFDGNVINTMRLTLC